MSVIAIKKVSNPQKIIAEILLEFPCNSGCTLKVSKTHSRLQTPTFAANNAGAVSLKGTVDSWTAFLPTWSHQGCCCNIPCRKKSLLVIKFILTLARAQSCDAVRETVPSPRMIRIKNSYYSELRSVNRKVLTASTFGGLDFCLIFWPQILVELSTKLWHQRLNICGLKSLPPWTIT